MGMEKDEDNNGRLPDALGLKGLDGGSVHRKDPTIAEVCSSL
jgi:hypothetical protein